MRHTDKLSGYFVLTLIILILWVLTIPGWNMFFRLVFRVEDPQENVRLTLILLPFYVFFMLGHMYKVYV